MIQTLVATLMWALVASLLIFRRKRTDRSITRAAFTIAIGMTLNVDAIYTVVDPLVDELVPLARSQREDPLAFLRNETVFGDLAGESAVTSPYLIVLGDLHAHGVREALRRLLAVGL